MSETAFCSIEFFDGCHFKEICYRANVTPTAKRIASLNIVIDRFYFPGHVDSWCHEHCDPNKFEALKN